MLIIRLKSTFKNPAPNLFKFLIPRQKINVDNKARFRYLDCYWFHLIDASICCAAAEAGIQLAIFA
jgi:hypothetical protein